jgi:V/A-type H+-transporting ATPase subunit D
MALKYAFNKVAMQSMTKQLKIRKTALPTLKSKEAALRTTVKKEKYTLADLDAEYKKLIEKLDNSIRVWGEFPLSLFVLNQVEVDVKKIAGIKTPELNRLDYNIENFSRFNNPAWLSEGINILKGVTEMLTKIEIERKKIEILEYARKKTTQKVNLYEKVQIPQYSEAILKIKRYLEDVDNLEKAAQKLTKQFQAEAAVSQMKEDA